MRILVFFTLFLPAVAGAQTFGGIGTRAEGMGGAFVAVADDASAVYWNPAGLATGATFDFQVSRADAPPGSTVFVGASLPVLGLSYYRTHTVQTPPDRHNEGTGRVPTRTLTTTNVGLTAVQTIVPGLVIGTTVRLVRGGIDQKDSRTTTDLDTGAMVSTGPFRLGIVGRNLRRPEFEDTLGPIALARQVRVGAALVPRSMQSGVHGPFSLAFDVDLTRSEVPSGGQRMAAVGGEYWMVQGLLGARAGVRWSTLDAAERALSGGLTVKVPGFGFIEGQLTKPEESADTWSVGARMTF